MLDTTAVGGAVVLLGLVQGWGGLFPRWVPFLSGRRVPIPLAVVPASTISALVAAVLMFVRMTLAGTLGRGPVEAHEARQKEEQPGAGLREREYGLTPWNDESQAAQEHRPDGIKELLCYK